MGKIGLGKALSNRQVRVKKIQEICVGCV
jgi:hypothetical protein